MSAFLYKWTGHNVSAWHKTKHFSAEVIDVDENRELVKLSDGNWYADNELKPEPKGKPPITDMVNHPPHYTQGDIECIDAIKAALTPDEFRGYCKGAAHKYIWRERHKGGDESLKKAVWYLNKAVEKKL